VQRVSNYNNSKLLMNPLTKIIPGKLTPYDTCCDGNDPVLNVRPKDLLSRVRETVGHGRSARRRRALPPVPPSWRMCRLTMSRAYFVAIVGVWIGGLAILLAVALAVRWS
jgi:hypothetical protein